MCAARSHRGRFDALCSKGWTAEELNKAGVHRIHPAFRVLATGGTPDRTNAWCVQRRGVARAALMLHAGFRMTCCMWRCLSRFLAVLTGALENC